MMAIFITKKKGMRYIDRNIITLGTTQCFVRCNVILF